MKAVAAFIVAWLCLWDAAASPEQGFSWPPAWQMWQTRVPGNAGEPLPTTGVALMGGGEIAVALKNGVAVLSADGQILRRATISSGENLAIARIGDDLAIASSETLLFVDGKTLEKKASIPVGGRVYQIASSEDGKWIAVARYGKTGVVISLPDMALKEIPLAGYSCGVTWIPDGNAVAFSTEASVEVFDQNGVLRKMLSCAADRRAMNSPKLTASVDGKWLIAYDENGAMKFWRTAALKEHSDVTYSRGGPWFAGFFASSPGKPFVGVPIRELSDTSISVLNSIPYSLSEVTGIAGRADGAVIFTTWRGDVVCWQLSAAPKSSELARPLVEEGLNAGEVPIRFQTGQAYFSPISEPTEGDRVRRTILRFVWKGEVLATFPIPGSSPNSSGLSSATTFGGRFMVVSTGAPPVKSLVTMEQLQQTPALAKALETMFEMQPSVYIVDGETGDVSPVGETRGIAAYYPSLNGVIACFAASAGSAWNGIATLDVESSKLLRSGETDLPVESSSKVFPMRADRVAATDRSSHRVFWMTHHEREIPKSEGPPFPTKLPFRPNGVWTTHSTTQVSYDVWTAAPSPDGSYLAVVTNRDTIDLLAWGEPSPTGCFPVPGVSSGAKLLSWRDNDTLVCTDSGGTVFFRVSRDLLRPVATLEAGKFLGIDADGKPCRVEYPSRSGNLIENGYNHIQTKSDRRRVVWLPSISSERWCEVPERNLVAHFMGGLWITDVATGEIIHGYNAPRAEGMAATKESVFTRHGDGSVFEWTLPPGK